MSVTCGMFYETPEGKIVIAYGSRPTLYMYYWLNKDGEREYSTEDHQVADSTWKIRTDLKDFPNTRDPRLPYVFDLVYDIKYVSELKSFLKTCDASAHRELKRYISEHNISL